MSLTRKWFIWTSGGEEAETLAICTVARRGEDCWRVESGVMRWLNWLVPPGGGECSTAIGMVFLFIFTNRCNQEESSNRRARRRCMILRTSRRSRLYKSRRKTAYQCRVKKIFYRIYHQYHCSSTTHSSTILMSSSPPTRQRKLFFFPNIPILLNLVHTSRTIQLLQPERANGNALLENNRRVESFLDVLLVDQLNLLV